MQHSFQDSFSGRYVLIHGNERNAIMNILRQPDVIDWTKEYIFGKDALYKYLSNINTSYATGNHSLQLVYNSVYI